MLDLHTHTHTKKNTLICSDAQFPTFPSYWFIIDSYLQLENLQRRCLEKTSNLPTMYLYPKKKIPATAYSYSLMKPK